MQAVEYQGPITALHYKQDRLYIGSGPYLREGPTKRRIFRHNKIHGITENGPDLVVWGGKSFASSPDFVEHTVCDWIICIECFDGATYILTAHNKVLIVGDQVESVQFDQSILYSGSIYCSKDKILVAAGTVLNGVLVWDLKTRTLVHNFTEHSGSIFGLDFSNDGRYLASCSDDRCIMIRDLHSGQQLASQWGHTARIWKLILVDDLLLSISEDLSCRIWRFDGFSLQQIDTLVGHSGRNVWALAVTKLGGRLLAATGGQDGRVKVWKKYLYDRLELQKPLQSFTQPLHGELYKSFVYNNGYFFFTTSGGRVFWCSKAFSQHGYLEHWDVGNYSLVRKYGEYTIIASKLGDITLICGTDSMPIIHRVPVDGHFTFMEAFALDGQTYVFIQTKEGPCWLVSLFPQQNGRLAEFSSPQTITAVHAVNNKLYAGTRTGYLYSMPLAAASTQDSEAFSTYLQSQEWTNLGRIFISKDAITSITSAEDALTISSRSGIYGLFKDDRAIFLNRMQKGGIEGLQYQANGDLLAYGFNKESMYIHNITHDYLVSTEHCGGGHRTWSITIDPEDEMSFHFSFVKASELHVIAYTPGVTSNAPTIVQRGLHGREIRGMDMHPTIPGLVATVSEDTTVSLGLVKDGQVHVSSCLRRHATPPQAVHWSQDGVLLATSGAKEELLVWLLHTQTHLLHIASLPITTVGDADADLRIMDFCIEDCTDGSHQFVCVYSDSTIRIWRFSGTEFQLLKQAKYTDRCLLHVNQIPGHILVTATDGCVLVYDTDLQLVHIQRVHQSGVRAAAVCERDGRFWHYSGGEDNCLAALNLATMKQEWKIPKAHSATITDVLVHDGKLLTTGPDQKICAWSLDGEQLDEVRTSISDTACLAAQQGRPLVLAAGLGVTSYLDLCNTT